MSKKIVVAAIAAVLVFGASLGAAKNAQAAGDISFAQLIEILINSGLIPQEKAANARAMVSAQVGAVSSPEAAPASTVQNTYFATVAASPYHSADIDKDWKISNTEASRVETLYNYRATVAGGTVRTDAAFWPDDDWLFWLAGHVGQARRK